MATAEKLKKITNIIKSAEWFQTVKNPEDMFIPHSFAVDSRYGSLYRMYSEMNKRNFSVQLDPQYSYSWKKSSSLYEMWCYICICRSFLQQYTEVGLRVQDIFMKDHLFPFLKSGTKILLENEDSAVEIIYDSVLPKKSEQVKLYGHPLYITGKHTRPDICINMYSKKSGWYVGSFIIECKYRSLKAFWYGNTWSSREQIKAYHNDSKSTRYFPTCSHNFPKAGEARFQGRSRLFRLLGKFPYLGESRRILMAVSSKTSSKTRFYYAATRRISSAAVQPSIWA